MAPDRSGHLFGFPATGAACQVGAPRDIAQGASMDHGQPRFDVLLCRAQAATPMFGLLGEALDDRGRLVALDLAEMHCITLFGEPGAGKSYCLGTLIEMAVAALPGLNRLPQPLATVVFHYSASQHYRPEFASCMAANDRDSQVALLKSRYGAVPAAVGDCLLLAPSAVVEERRREFPGLPVAALTFTSADLQAGHWRILMGALGEEDSLYLQVVNQILRRHRRHTTIARVAQEIEASSLAQADRDRAQVRLALAAQYLDDQGPAMGSHIRPGRLVLVDLRDEFLQKKEALALLVVLVQLVADVSDQGRPLQKLCVFDEAHKYLRDAELVEVLTETIREMRHKSTSILIASQDPPSVPLPMIELSTLVVLLRMSSPRWLEHVAAVKPAFRELAPAQLARLLAGSVEIAHPPAQRRATGELAPERTDALTGLRRR